MASGTINVLLTSFPGLGLPRTLSLPMSTNTQIKDIIWQIADHLPPVHSRLILTTTSNKAIDFTSELPVTSLLSAKNEMFLPLRLTVPLCGGKGGFGSQLRAAGGRMSSKRKKNQGDATSSNRNLDGRRLRTVNEAKALAEYLALKPDMEKKEKEARRKRWEQVLELTEKREEEVKNGSKGRVDGQWVEDKEEAGDRARSAVLAAVKSGQYSDNLVEVPSSSRSWTSKKSEHKKEAREPMRYNQNSIVKPLPSASRTFEGFDIDDDFISSSEEEEQEQEQEDDRDAGGEDGEEEEVEDTEEEEEEDEEDTEEIIDISKDSGGAGAMIKA